jgi:hypothetical protein
LLLLQLESEAVEVEGIEEVEEEEVVVAVMEVTVCVVVEEVVVEEVIVVLEEEEKAEEEEEEEEVEFMGGRLFVLLLNLEVGGLLFSGGLCDSPLLILLLLPLPTEYIRVRKERRICKIWSHNITLRCFCILIVEIC